MLIKEVLKNGIDILKKGNIDTPILKAKIILAHILKMSKEQLLIYDNKQIEEFEINKYNKAIKELIDGKPLQYITNKQEFMKLDFYVDENVLIPRADTEILVEEVINICKKNVNKQYKILDLCAGSGAIGISIAKYIENSEVTQVDISSKALEISKRNATRHNVDTRMKFIQSNMFENIQDKYDIIVSNPPYIKTDIIKTLDKQVQNEPNIALDGGKDGLNFYRIIIDNAYKYLNNSGHVCLEIGYDQKQEVIDLVNCSNKYINIVSKKDLYGNDRVILFDI